MRTETLRLLRQARNGDPTAIGPLLVYYTRYLVLMARMQVGKRLQMKVDSEDLVQETFLEAHRQFSRFRGTTEAEFAAWLRTIMAGQIAMMCRRFLGTRARDVQLERELRFDWEDARRASKRGLAASGHSPSQQLACQEQALMLAEAIARLSAEYREVVMLRQLEELSFATTALRMNRSEDSVQKLWVRALKRLRDMLKAYEE